MYEEGEKEELRSAYTHSYVCESVQGERLKSQWADKNMSVMNADIRSPAIK